MHYLGDRKKKVVTSSANYKMDFYHNEPVLFLQMGSIRIIPTSLPEEPQKALEKEGIDSKAF